MYLSDWAPKSALCRSQGVVPIPRGKVYIKNVRAGTFVEMIKARIPLQKISLIQDWCITDRGDSVNYPSWLFLHDLLPGCPICCCLSPQNRPYRQASPKLQPLSSCMTIFLSLPRMGNTCDGCEITQDILEIGLAYERLTMLPLSVSLISLCVSRLNPTLFGQQANNTCRTASSTAGVSVYSYSWPTILPT